MEAFKVAPFDQNLFINGQKLKDSDLTLRELRVLPKSLIYLRADEPNPGAAAIEPDDAWTLQHPEEGFKGTFLPLLSTRVIVLSPRLDRREIKRVDKSGIIYNLKYKVDF